MSAAIKIETQGRRHYLRGNTYPIKDQLRAAGAKWDPDARCWWTGKRETAEAIVAKAGSAAPPAPGSDRGEASREAPGEGAIVAGRATYQGKTYYVMGRVDRGRSHWDDRVAPVSTRDGAKLLLVFRDGSKTFWASRYEVQVIKSYSRPTTIGKLQRFAEEAKTHGTDECRCSCHREPNAGAPGSTLYDGCDRCGCEAC